MSEDEIIQAVQIKVEGVTDKQFRLCLIGYDGQDVFGHFHVIVSKEDEMFHIVDSDDENGKYGVSVPGPIMKALFEFMEAIAESPDLVLTDSEKAQIMANETMAAMFNPN